jgi:hypothetical protein
MHITLFSGLALGCLVQAPAAFAQDVLLVTDTNNDRVVTCTDLNADGDWNDAGEVVVLYDDVAGAIPLSNNVGICAGPGNTVYVSDTTEDIVLALTDQNADGDALDLGEAKIFFDGRVGGNASGVIMTSAFALTYQASTGKVWVATQNTASGLDEILVLQDLAPFDGDANDLGEVQSYWTAPAGATNAYAPQGIVVESSGRVVYVDSGVSSNKGAYSLIDLNSDGDAQDPGERQPFFVLPVPVSPNPLQQLFGFEQDSQGWFYMADFAYDVVYRFKDLNSDGDAMDPGESSTFFSGAPGASTFWDIAATPCGTIYVSEGTAPQRFFALLDANADGVIGGGESTEVFNDSAGNPVAIGSARGIAVRAGSCGTPTTSFCLGDGTGAACPCGNTGAVGHGCASSAFATGAILSSSGNAGASAGTDTLVLTATGIPGPGLFFQANGLLPPINFGDGHLCAAASIIRLGVVFSTGGVASYPGGITPNPIHIGGLTSNGDTRHYQCWYRSVPSLCTVMDNYDVTQGLTLTWGP